MTTAQAALAPKAKDEMMMMSKERFERMAHAELVDVVMGLLTAHSEVKAERDMLRQTVCRIDLGSFCSNTVPDFAPLGGGHPDCAVVMGQLVSQYDTESTKLCGAALGCCLPPDVADTGMAFLCAPVLITSLVPKLDVTTPHDTVACRLQLKTAEELESLSEWIPRCRTLKLTLSPSSSAILETPENFLSEVAAPISIDLTALPCTTLKRGFAAFSAFTGVRFPATLEEIDDDCCRNCENLAVLDLTSTRLKIIKRNFATHCPALTDIRFPATLEEIEGMSFSNCKSLAVLDFTSTRLKTIEGYSAAHCPALTDVRFPATLEEIGYFCFENCENLAVLDLTPTSVKIIKEKLHFAQNTARLHAAPAKIWKLWLYSIIPQTSTPKLRRDLDSARANAKRALLPPKFCKYML